MEHQKAHKILLIEPPFYRLFKDSYALVKYPLGLGYLAGAILDKTDWKVLVYNADFTPLNDWISTAYMTGKGFADYQHKLKDETWFLWKEIKAFVKEYAPSVVGISTRSGNFASARIVARLCKETNREIIVIMGGPHISMAKQDVFDCPDVDICVNGEGEATIVELLKTFESGASLDEIKGIIYRKDAKVIENPPREFITDLDALTFPNKTVPIVLKDYQDYPASAFKSIFASRGCPYSCLFCGSHKLWGRQVRLRSPENVAEEIDSLRQKGLKSVHFEDDTFGISKDYINDFCAVLSKRCPGMKWSCEIHINLIDEETLSMLKKAGCYLVQIGIESGNNEILKKVRKGFTIEKAMQAVKLVKRFNIEVSTFFMVGFPWETRQTLADTAKAMRNIQTDYLAYSIFTPYPGTEIFKLCQEQGLVGENYDASLYNHQSPENHFCSALSKKEFRDLAGKIERMVDNINKRKAVKRMFSEGMRFKIKETGILRSLRKASNVFLKR